MDGRNPRLRLAGDAARRAFARVTHAYEQVASLPPSAGYYWPAIIRVTYLVRIAIGAGVSIGIWLVPAIAPEARTRILIIFGAGLVPYAVVVLLGSLRYRTSAFGLLTVVGDLAFAFVAHVAAPSTRYVALFAYLLIVGFNTALAGLLLGIPMALAAIGLFVVAQILVPPEAVVDPLTSIMFGVVLAGLALVVDTATREQRRTNAALATLHRKTDMVLGSVADGIVATDERGVIVQWNEGAARIFRRDRDDALRRGCADMIGLRVDGRPADCEGGCALLGTAGAAQVFDREVWREREGGGVQPLIASAVTVRDPESGTVEVVHAYRDVTRLKEAEEAKALFLSTASHELRTPLTAVIGFAETLRMRWDELPERQRDYALKVILNEAERLNRIVDRLVLSGSIERGHVHVSPADVDLPGIVVECVDRIRREHEREIELRIDPRVPLCVADATALATALDHILDNAVKYSPEGGPVHVEVAARGDDVLVAVRDEGIGMDEEQLRHAFDKFWQADTTDARRFGGTGMGLYIVRALVESMGGRVWAQSRPGAGATFWVALRRSDAGARRAG